MPTTLLVTNDFPPRIGGIESFGADLCQLLDGDVVVLTSGPPGAAATDAGRGYRVVRAGGLLLPTPATARLAADLLRASGASRVVFGAAAPLGLLARPLRAAGAHRVVALTHGHECWWASVPAARAVLRRIGDAVDHLTAISGYTAARVRPALSPAAAARLLRLPPPVDLARFRPGPRPEPGGDLPRTVAVARFVPQKGLTTLLHAWRTVSDRLGPAELTLVGDGPQRRDLERLVHRLGLAGRVRLTGALDRDGVVAELQRAQVFALPVRTRWAGLNPEGLGLAALEAAACGLPVVVGGSGGAPETVRDGETGYVVPPGDPAALADRLTGLLRHPGQARAWGARGRDHVADRFGRDQVRRTLRSALDLP